MRLDRLASLSVIVSHPTREEFQDLEARSTGGKIVTRKRGRGKKKTRRAVPPTSILADACQTVPNCQSNRSGGIAIPKIRLAIEEGPRVDRPPRILWEESAPYAGVKGDLQTRSEVVSRRCPYPTPPPSSSKKRTRIEEC